MRILIADDDKMLLDCFQRWLPRFHVDVVGTAANGLDLVDLYRRNADQVDLVLTDYNMPRMSGLEAATRILAIDPRAVVVLMSGYELNESAIHHTGIRALLKKSDSVESMIRSLFSALTEEQEGLCPTEPGTANGL